jgi:hypothetical protein
VIKLAVTRADDVIGTRTSPLDHLNVSHSVTQLQAAAKVIAQPGHYAQTARHTRSPSASPDDIFAIMSDSLLIRNLPESLKPALRRRAAAHGRSVEAEARAILEEAVAADEDFVSWWLDEMTSVPPGKPLPVPDRSGESREPVTYE